MAREAVENRPFSRTRRLHYSESASELGQLALTTSLRRGESPLFCACSATVVCISGVSPSVVALAKLSVTLMT